jgi:hypothetical protein
MGRYYWQTVWFHVFGIVPIAATSAAPPSPLMSPSEMGGGPIWRARASGGLLR